MVGRRPSEVGTLLKGVFQENDTVYPSKARRIINRIRVKRGQRPIGYQYVRTLFSKAASLELIVFDHEEKVTVTEGVRVYDAPPQLSPRRHYRALPDKLGSQDWDRLPEYLTYHL